MTDHVCTICNCDYSDDEGGMEGYFGILPVSFCSTCFSCMLDMVELFVGVKKSKKNDTSY